MLAPAMARPRLSLVPLPAALSAEAERARCDRAAELYRAHGQVIYRRCLRLLRDPDAARDATQEVFIRLLRNLERLEERVELLPWLYRVASNHCLNLIRDGRARPEVDLEARGEEPSPAPSAADGILARSLLSRCDAATQAIVLAVVVEEQDQEEVARALGVSRRTVARKLESFFAHARREVLGEEQGEAATH